MNQELLENNYRKNLKLFQQNIPSIYQKLITQSDTRYALELFNNEINISFNNSLIYPKGDVNNYFKAFLSKHLKKETANVLQYDIHFEKEDNSLERFDLETIDIKYKNKIFNQYVQSFNKEPLQNEPKHNFIYCYCMFGIGLGYHIIPILKQYDIKHLILADINIEMLSVSLYTIDWSEIFQYVYQKNKDRTLTILIDEKSLPLEKQLVNFLVNYIPNFYCNLWSNTSYKSDYLDQSISGIIKSMDLILSSKGFFDDENWGLQNTLENLKNKVPLLINNSLKVDKEKHVFIVANGPSLDNYINVIKEYRDNVVLIACGTAFGSLYKYGIVADILIEMERTMATYHAVQLYAPEEVLKGVKFIGMNTINPEVFKMFESSFMFCKNNDAGTKVINQYSQNEYPIIPYTNPTVANTATSLALYFGFKNLSLFGMDFGYKSLDQHHSKNSFYYEKESKFYTKEHTSSIEIEGINGDVILTENVFNTSRKVLEYTIEEAKKQNHIDVYNFSDGAYINGVVRGNIDSSYLKDIVTISKTNKEVLNTIEQFFIIDNVDIDIDYEKIVMKLNNLINLIKENNKKSINTYELLQLQDKFHELYKEYFKEDKYVYLLLKDTVFSLFSYIYIPSSSHKNSKKVSFFISTSLEILIECLVDIRDSFSKLEMDFK